MDVIIYTRVTQNNQSNLPQIRLLNDVCQKNGWNIIQTFSEIGSGLISGNQRPTLTSLLNYTKTTKVDYIICTDIGKLSRKTSDVNKLIEWLHKLKIGIWTAELNESSLDSELSLQRLLKASEKYEKETETMKAALVKRADILRRKRGAKAGRKEGYKKPEETLLADHKDIIQLLNEGVSIRKIAKQTNKSTTTVQKVKKAIN